jgi:hypothetical protein
VDSSDWESKYDIENIRFSGFIAQEVEAAAKEIGYNFSGVDAPKNEDDFYGLRYAEFVVPLVKAVQELAEQNENLIVQQESFKNEITDLKRQMANYELLKTKLEAIEKQITTTSSSEYE